ncbi:MAG: hypothetical protein RR436_05850, partial [Clostridia bacterium]
MCSFSTKVNAKSSFALEDKCSAFFFTKVNAKSSFAIREVTQSVPSPTRKIKNKLCFERSNTLCSFSTKVN